MAQARKGQPLSTTILDAHAHILHPNLNGAGGNHVMHQSSPTQIHQLARRMGVDRVGIMSWNGIMTPDPDDGNQCVTQALDAVPDFFWGLATFDTIHDPPLTLLQKMTRTFADPRFLGLKPYPTFGYHYDHPRYIPWWHFANDVGLYAALHPNTWDLAEFDNLCPKYPNVTFIAYHAGRDYHVADAVIDKAKKYPNFLAEITYTSVCMGIIDYLAQHAGPDRILYGSDLPMRDPRPQLGWVVYARLPVEHKQMILGRNMLKLINKVQANRGKTRL